VFNSHHSETEMLRYIRSLSDKDLALDRSMIPLGSCTMKLNATSEMIPITWPEFAHVHPFAPRDQLAGYWALNDQLCAWLARPRATPASACSPTPAARANTPGCWSSRPGTRPRRGPPQHLPDPGIGARHQPGQRADGGHEVVVTKCDAMGNVDMDDLKAKCEQHSANLAAVMITYPSTHGVFEVRVKELCALVHRHGGRVYVDGANMNALVGVAAPGEFGGDVSHLNLHKTFCIPHGGGGPGVGPVAVVADLVPFLPAHRTPGSAAAPQRGRGQSQRRWATPPCCPSAGCTAA
jgi:glycine dehydrogenase